MTKLRRTILLLDLFLTAAIAGFFYAWSASVMRGLDTTSPEVAIRAMQAINAEVRNAVFAPAFFGPAVLGLLLIGFFLRRRDGASERFAACAALAYLAGGFGLTLAINVPMNEALAVAPLPADTAAQDALWRDYSGPWTFWNHVRTAASFVSLGLLVAALRADLRERADDRLARDGG